MLKLVSPLELFIVFFKIGLFMFGGGYGGIALLHKELVEINKWLSDEEFVEILGIAESTPGPVAINSATYIGYRLCGVLGSLTATLGVVLPAYLVILAIAAGLSKYLDTPLAKVLFRGINAAVVALIFIALLKVGQTVLIKNGVLDLISLAIGVIAFLIVYALNQHPIVAILTSAGLSLTLKFLFGI